MSTRTNIKITDGQQTLYLYRHCDGYPAEAGSDIYEVAKELDGTRGYNPDWIRAVNKFMTYLYDATEYRPARPVYELTDSTHGDIEHFYHVAIRQHECPHNNPYCNECEPKSYVKVYHAKGYGPELEWECLQSCFTPDEFAEVVNADRRAINQRLKALREEQPEPYGNAEDYPMVGASA